MSELHAKPRSRGRSLFWPAYMLSWAVLAGGALAYLSLNALPSSNQFEAIATLPKSTPESNLAELDRERLNAQVRSLNDTIAKLRGDLARLKSEKQKQIAAVPTAPADPTIPQSEADLPEASSITTSSLAKSEPSSLPAATVPDTSSAQNDSTLPTAPTETAEASPNSNAPLLPKIMNAPTTSPPAATAQPTQVAAAPPRRPRNLATSPLRSGRVPPLPRINAALTDHSLRGLGAGTKPQTNLQAPSAQPLNTASLPIANNVVRQTPAAGAGTFGVSTVTQRPLPTAAALSLSTAQSVTGLRASWLLLTSRHPETFNRLQPRYIADQANSTYRLLAGPILSHAEADRICTELRAQSVSCGVTSYVGSALQ